MKTFNPAELKRLFIPSEKSSGEDNGQVTIIGGSKLFHGAPLLALKVASRMVDMVFFASPEPSVGRIAEHMKSKLMSFIWVPWEDLEAYIEKSDAVLVGPGLMRFGSEVGNQKSDIGYQKSDDRKPRTEKQKLDGDGRKTRDITKRLLLNYPNKKWVIDAGSLQVMDPEWIPEGSIITPNKKEFEMLFKVKFPKVGSDYYEVDIEDMVDIYAHKYKCIIVLKGQKTIVSSSDYSRVISGGNPGLTKGGTGDVLAGLTVALLAKNDPFLTACSASYIEKKAADELYEKVGVNYNADDLTDQIPKTLHKLNS